MKKLLLIALCLSSSLSARTDHRQNSQRARLHCKRHMITEHRHRNLAREHNGDDINVADFAGSFSKTLAHDGTTGVLTQAGQTSYEQLLAALLSGEQEDFNAIALDDASTRGLVSPQAAHARSLIGAPSSVLSMPSAPTLASRHAATEIIEVYLKAICRNVKFADYGTATGTDLDPSDNGSFTNKSAAVMTALGEDYKGPSNAGVVTAAHLFRGVGVGCTTGPYLSQFMYLPISHLSQTPVAQHCPVAQAREFGVKWEDYVAIQNGTVPAAYDGTDFSGSRHIINGKDAGTSVHGDLPSEFFLNAIRILLGNGFPTAPNFPYNNGSITNEQAFLTMHVADVLPAVFMAGQEALKHAWAHKWLANRRLRPEAMAGLVHQVMVTTQNPYDLHSVLFSPVGGTDVLAWVKARNVGQESIPNNSLGAGEGETYLLPLMYPEGSPTHPSYPAGHAVLAGACATIVKAFFDDTALIKDYVTPVKPNPADPTTLVDLTAGEGANEMTVAGELNKLAANIALARNFAGVHYRSDGDDGIALGEKVALKLLQDWAATYHEEDFAGYELTLLNGERARITKSGMTIIS